MKDNSTNLNSGITSKEMISSILDNEFVDPFNPTNENGIESLNHSTTDGSKNAIHCPDENAPSMEPYQLEAWRSVWRNGFAPLISTAGLQSLRKALLNDDPRLTQGSTTTPPPLMCVQDWAVEGACALGFCGWQGEGLETVGEVEEFFARSCYEADQRLGEPAACRWFLNWFDDTPRAEMRDLLCQEVARTLAERISGEEELLPETSDPFADRIVAA